MSHKPPTQWIQLDKDCNRYTQGDKDDCTFSSRLFSRGSGLRFAKMRRSRVCRTVSAGVRGFDLNKPFILSGLGSERPPSVGSLRSGAADEEALRPPDWPDKQAPMVAAPDTRPPLDRPADPPLPSRSLPPSYGFLLKTCPIISKMEDSGDTLSLSLSRQNGQYVFQKYHTTTHDMSSLHLTI